MMKCLVLALALACNFAVDADAADVPSGKWIGQGHLKDITLDIRDDGSLVFEQSTRSIKAAGTWQIEQSVAASNGFDGVLKLSLEFRGDKKSTVCSYKVSTEGLALDGENCLWETYEDLFKKAGAS